MRHKFKALIACLIAGLVFLSPALAATEIDWKDLQPPEDGGFLDPFAELTDEQLFSLSNVAQYRELENQIGVLSAFDQEGLDTETLRLKEWNIDVDEMLEKRDEAIAYYEERGSEVNAELNGKSVRIPGYLLPLEYEDERVTEFLLVPYVGACIHTPPPPANQIVKVSSEGGFVTSDMFTPIWVEGKLKTEQLSTDLSFVDGSADVSVGYVMEADMIELYE